MKLRLFCTALLLLTTSKLTKVESVKVLVIREEDSDRSEESSGEHLSAEESEEIQLLMDLIKSEAHDSRPPPLTTVKVLTRQPSSQSAEQSVRKERHELNPKENKEYHIHYHNHQHKSSTKHLLNSEDQLRPALWDPSLSLFKGFKDFDDFKVVDEEPASTYSPIGNKDIFKDFESFMKSKLRSSHSFNPPSQPQYHKKIFKDFDTIEPPKKKTYEKSFEHGKEFGSFFNFGKSNSLSDDDFPNKNRFAAFKDFSEIESGEPEPEPKPIPKKSSKPKDRDTGYKGVAIVIRSKPSTSIANKEKAESEHQVMKMKTLKAPNIPPLVNNYRNPTFRTFTGPRIIESAGGAPKYIEDMNRLKQKEYEERNSGFRNYLQHNMNFVENTHHRLFPFPHTMSNAYPHHPRTMQRNNNIVDGWLIRRLM